MHRDEVLEAITDIVCSIEAALPRTLVRSAVGDVVPRHPHALRLLAALQARPTPVVSAENAMPPALDRLIQSLLGEGATRLRLPACGHCLQERALTARDGAVRICDTCDAKRRHSQTSCACCGQLRRRRATAAGQHYCGTCWDTLAKDAGTTLLSVLRAHLPRATDEQARAAVAALKVPGDGGLLRLALEYRAFGSGWMADPSAGPRPFLRLYESLRAEGVPLPPPGCGHCGKTVELKHVLEQRLCCRRCYTASRTQACDGCGTICTITRREPDGKGLCQGCANKLPDQSAPCTGCGNLRKIALDSPDGPLCPSCRARQRVDTCRTCRRVKPCLYEGTPRARCHDCSKPKERCVRCDRTRTVGTRDSNGQPLCKSCGRRREACADCGRDRHVAGRSGTAPLCEDCWPKSPASFRTCQRCGQHRYVHRDGHCDRCAANDKIHGLFPTQLTARVPEALALRDWCLGADETAILSTFGRKRTVELLRTVLSAPGNLSHDFLDAAGSAQATGAVRSLLVEHGLLPPRDENLSRLERWVTTTAELIADPAERRAFVRFARWRHLNTLRRRPQPIPSTLTTSRRRELRIVRELLDWAPQHGKNLSTLNQADLQRWQATTHSETHRVKAFLAWAHRNKLAGRLSVSRPPHPGLALGGPGLEERRALLRSVTASDSHLPAARKLAAALVILFGLQPHQIVRLQIRDIDHEHGKTRLRLGADPLHLPDEIAAIALEARANRTAPRLFRPTTDPTWLLPGTRHDHPLTTQALIGQLRALGIEPNPHRTAALGTLAQTLPPAILARLTGLSMSNAVRWSTTVAASNARYAPLTDLARTAGPEPAGKTRAKPSE
ncbi:hypothetical protein M8J71_08975 [Pseudarthrobacter sp. R1]|uniref:hypothetical protein n=1 Tax=Pseudarthrobacter sp. R1 TaxID=2944934 RepID=UPI00210EDD48|nr:hypothetical protein [Pseudarthrobacter sp. R1]MCQ6270608.1 hypothetical protein [Pseudarthrobacter sp. R1]